MYVVHMVYRVHLLQHALSAALANRCPSSCSQCKVLHQRQCKCTTLLARSVMLTKSSIPSHTENSIKPSY